MTAPCTKWERNFSVRFRTQNWFLSFSVTARVLSAVLNFFNQRRWNRCSPTRSCSILISATRVSRMLSQCWVIELMIWTSSLASYPEVWGVGFMSKMDERAKGRGKGTGWWAGLANLYWWCDRAKSAGGIVQARALKMSWISSLESKKKRGRMQMLLRLYPEYDETSWSCSGSTKVIFIYRRQRFILSLSIARVMS